MRPSEVLNQGIDVTKVNLGPLSPPPACACPLSGLAETSAHPAFALLSNISRQTWRRLALADQFGVRQSEETITDVVLLTIAASALAEVTVSKKATKAEESRAGFDWEWWIGSPNAGYIEYCVQAKRLHQGEYCGLERRARHLLQFRRLLKHARKKGAVALYAFYNWMPSGHTASVNCKLQPPLELLGCSIAPLSVVKTEVGKPGRPTFEAMHSHSNTIPWRCLLCRQQAGQHVQLSRWPVRWHAALPEDVRIRTSGEDVNVALRTSGDRGEFRPRRTMVITLPPQRGPSEASPAE